MPFALAIVGFVSATFAFSEGGIARARVLADITPQRLTHADAEPGEWFTGGRDYQQSYYSPLTSINATNVRNLGFAWDYSFDAIAPLYATPILSMA